MKLTEEELKAMLICIDYIVTKNQFDADLQKNMSKEFKQKIHPLITRLIKNDTCRTKDITQLYMKVSEEYLKIITS
ncbi:MULTISPECIES: hypothetical protein [Bacillus]|uniref:hypothetical protein n=1 Tax=Bacillus TaxID=1386 RepID=UPI0003144F5B|nr:MULTISPECIES: hypothetical protein [Bacillus]